MPGIEKSAENINAKLEMLTDDMVRVSALIRETLESSRQAIVGLGNQLQQSGQSLSISISSHRDTLEKAASDLSGSVLTIHEILSKAAESADKHAAGLKKATIALAIATIFLMIATAGLIFQPIILKWFGFYPK